MKRRKVKNEKEQRTMHSGRYYSIMSMPCSFSMPTIQVFVSFRGCLWVSLLFLAPTSPKSWKFTFRWFFSSGPLTFQWVGPSSFLEYASTCFASVSVSWVVLTLKFQKREFRNLWFPHSANQCVPLLSHLFSWTPISSLLAFPCSVLTSRVIWSHLLWSRITHWELPRFSYFA